jgi:translocation and assembly module TamB
MARERVSGDEGGETIVVRRRPGWQRIAGIGVLVVLVLAVIAVAVVWTARRPIATEILRRQFEQRNVRATYQLERVGLRTQEIRNLVIGDPKDPDLVARYAQIQLRWTLAGSVEVYRIVARGVRLEGKVVHNRVVWGDVSKLMPPPSDKPFALPNIVLDVADATIGLQTPFGPLGFSLAGSGNLTGGFKGKVAATSPGLDMGRCRLSQMNVLAAVEVIARRPRLSGPLAASDFACPTSNILIANPRFDIDTRFNESFTSFEGRGRMGTPRFVAGANGLANLIGNITFKGTPKAATGTIDAAAQKSRLGPISAERTRVRGRYLMGANSGTLSLVGQFSANDSALAPSVLAGVTDPLSATEGTPLGPVATAIGRAITNTSRRFDASGDIILVNRPSGGAARLESTQVRSPNGARASVSGGDGVTYYWPTGKLRIDGRIEMAGGGLPTGTVLLRQPRGGGPLSGEARFAPYQAGPSRLALDPIRFRATASGGTQFNTAAILDGPFSGGRIEGLRLPLDGQFGPNGRLAVGQGCVVASWRFVRFQAVQFGPTRLPICAIGPAIITSTPSGGVNWGARLNAPRLNGRVGDAPLSLAADSGRVIGKTFTLANLKTRLGNPASPVVFDAARLEGLMAGKAINGTFSDARSTIGTVPLLLSDARGRWRFLNGRLSVNGGLTLSDRTADQRFYPLKSNDFTFTLAGDDIRANGTLIHPASGTRISDVNIHHSLTSGNGQAILDVPGLTFGPNLQPEEITRLTEGVIALVNGTLTGRGEINWTKSGTVTSTGDFSTAGMDLAAPFGPVTGLAGNIHFTDLLGLETAPRQTVTVKSINPGILVENGVIRYQLLPGQLVKVERGEWPFMGGTLILHETILNLGKPSAKRLTFEVVGFNAKMFIDSLGFQGIEITGIFDGVLPMIFDDNGGRIVGGRLESRLPGGEFRYTGTKPNAGMAAGLAFDLLSNIRYRNMVISLNGDLAGEFASNFEINEVSLSNKGGFVSNLARRALSKVPLKVNLNIKGPFRALIQTAKAFKDPTVIIQPVLPFPLDTPGLVTETKTFRKEETQQTTTPTDKVEVTPTPQPSE